MTHIYYHYPCCDGFMAYSIARTVALKMGHSTIIAHPVDLAAKPELDPDSFTKEDFVWILDCSFPREVLDEVYARAGQLIVLDHHPTASHLADAPYATIDTKKCGALLTWSQFYPVSPVPCLLGLIDIRDRGLIWTEKDYQQHQVFENEGRLARAAHVGLMELCPHSADCWWERLVTTDFNSVWLLQARDYREAIHAKMIEGLLKTAHYVKITYGVGRRLILPAISHAPRIIASDLLHQLACSSPVGLAGTWYASAEGITWSLRSTPEGPHCGYTAQLIDPNGGGHQGAGGFTTQEPVVFVEEFPC